jgi:hypothetical protein
VFSSVQYPEGRVPAGSCWRHFPRERPAGSLPRVYCRGMGLHDAEPAGRRHYAIGGVVVLVVLVLIVAAASELQLLHL